MGRRTTGESVDYSKFATVITSRLEESGISMRQASRESGLSFGALSSYASGRSLPNLIQFIKLCDWLDENPAFLMSTIKVRK